MDIKGQIEQNVGKSILVTILPTVFIHKHHMILKETKISQQSYCVTCVWVFLLKITSIYECLLDAL